MAKIGFPPISKVSEEPAPLTQKELKAYEESSLVGTPENYISLTKEQVEIISEFQKARGLQQDIDERKKYANKTFKLVSLWIVGIFILLILSGLKLPYYDFELPDSVLLAVIGGTTLNILGIFIFVMKYLFDPRKGP